MEPTDAELIAAVIQGDSASFEPLIVKYQPRVFATARRYARRESEVEDIVQEVFIKAFQKLNGFRGEAPFEHWLMRLAVRTCYDFLRGHQRNREVAFATKPQIAIALLEEALADGICPGPVLADSVYGDNSDFRSELRRLKLEFFLQVTGSSLKGWTSPVPTERKFKRRYVSASAPASQTLAEITAELPGAAWKHCSWKAADGHTRRP